VATFSEFVTAQDKCWPAVVSELRKGYKSSHWIWWVFPQLAILGRSPRAVHFGLRDLNEATAYLAHPKLGIRLIETTSLLAAQKALPPVDILGEIDALKVRSSMTLFEAVPSANPIFTHVLNAMYAGTRCPVTTDALSA